MFFDVSVQRIRVGCSNSVNLNSRVVFIPASFTVLWKTVPTPGGPSVALRISCTRGLNFLSFSPFARNAKTSPIGRLIVVVAENPEGIGRILSQWPTEADRTVGSTLTLVEAV